MDAEFYIPRFVEEVEIKGIQEDVGNALVTLGDSYHIVEQKLATVFQNINTHNLKLDSLLEEIQAPETVIADKSYRILGVSGQGNGPFVRSDKKGREIKAATLFKVTSGLLIYNRLFAFKGSFGLLLDQHDGCYVSNEFPTFKIKDEVEYKDIVAKYIVHCLNSPFYLNTVDAHSTGSTKQSRNRFSQEVFLSMEVSFPTSINDTKEIVNLLDRADDLRQQQLNLLDKFKHLRNGISLLLPRSAK